MSTENTTCQHVLDGTSECLLCGSGAAEFAAEVERLRGIVRLARAHRAAIHLRLHPVAVNNTGEALDEALNAEGS